MNEEQITQVLSQFKAGLEKETIKDALLAAGYTGEAADALVSEALKRMQIPIPPTRVEHEGTSNLSTPISSTSKLVIPIIVLSAVMVIAVVAFAAFPFFGGSDSENLSEKISIFSSKDVSCEAQYQNLLSLYGQDYSDCTVAVSEFDECSATPQDYKVSVVFDSSGSMAGQVFGERKLDVAREETLRALGVLDASDIDTGIIVYGHEGSNKEVDKAVSCKRIEALRPISKGGFESSRTALNALKPTGWTPIADALRFAANQFSGTNGYEEIILVTDGIETCDGDPVAVVRALQAQGIDAVTVIGFDVTGDDESELSAIAEAGSGRYFSAGSRIELEQAFDSHRQWSERFDCTMDQFAQNLGDYLDVNNQQFECTHRLKMDEAFPITMSVSLNNDGVTDQCIPHIKEKYEKRYYDMQENIKEHFMKLMQKVIAEDPFAREKPYKFEIETLEW